MSTPLKNNERWEVVLLMDHREFNHTGFLDEVKQRIDSYFNDKHHHRYPHQEKFEYCEKQTLVSADYMFVARKVAAINGNGNGNGKGKGRVQFQVLDERVLDTIIERKNVNDMQQCLILKSKEYKPLTFFEAQMYKLQQCGIPQKIFLMEGDEDDPSQFWGDGLSANSNSNGKGKAQGKGKGTKTIDNKLEHEKRRKRVKTMRLQLAGGEYHGVDLVCTRNKDESVQYLIDQMVDFKANLNSSLDLHLRLPTRTMQDVKTCVHDGMNGATFQEYLRLTKLKGIGDAKAMKTIMDPEKPWDKSFISPACISRKTKSTLDDRPTFYVSPSASSVTATNTVQPQKRQKTHSKASPRSSSTSTSRSNDQHQRRANRGESGRSTTSTSTTRPQTSTVRPTKKPKTTPMYHRNNNVGILSSTSRTIDAQIYRSELGLTSPEVVQLLTNSVVSSKSNSRHTAHNVTSPSSAQRHQSKSVPSSRSFKTVKKFSPSFTTTTSQYLVQTRPVSKHNQDKDSSISRPIEIDLTRSPGPVEIDMNVNTCLPSPNEKETWMCEKCTFINENICFLACEMCGDERP